MQDIGFGVVGSGFMGKCHALALAAVAATFEAGRRPVLKTLCDVDPAAAAKARAWGFSRFETDWRVLLDDPGIEAISVTTPNRLHREIAVAALAAGKHVWCEKPMAHRLDDAQAMARAARASDRVTLLGYNYTRNPALAHARRLIGEGRIGRVFDFRGQIDEDYLADPALPWSWRMRRAEAGAGVAGDLVCHLLSIASMLVGPVAQIAGLTATAHARRPLADGSGSGAVENEDIAHALLRFANGASGVIGASRVAHGRKSLIRVEIHGEKGMIAFDQERMNELQLYLAEGPPAERGFRTILTGPEHPPYGLFCPAPGHQLGFNDLKTIEAAHFLRAIAGQETPFPDFEAGLHIERVLEALAESAAQGGWRAP